ncbi:efflux RND transporter periplasmic adaptor subunit [Marinicella sp. S1101]|uniref:efflux RND transporter periplasmic adaptor subunit n=1 Tax=Marinicella marina TaxID=2996016 RepID=UPI002260BBA7|nr:efflux RND transporter periplasmic adaptor subunit [Marinicella marina]MCX7553656.1 efflux RND transporter periplasmic adaptor subunit [Marinicella marina]MDJ1140280.1 efflux RND transporter periplasmic adaptor subunit [Marinicella marina]
MSANKTEGFSTGKTIAISVLIIAAALLFSLLIFSTEPEAQREGATNRTAMLVQTEAVAVGDFKPIITAMGTVMAAKEIDLQARVNGAVIKTSTQFIPGQIIQQDEMILQIDAADYETQKQQAMSELAQARADLQIEMGEQMAAKRDFDRLNRAVDETQKSLILRKPQLANAQARVQSAQAALTQAELNLQRTEIKAPFSAQILSTSVNIGSQVNSGDDLAELIGVETFWVEATVGVNQLAWIDSQQNAPAVKVVDDLAWPKDQYRMGELLSVVGEVDAATRMPRVLIVVDDPLALTDDDIPALTLGAYVLVHIPAKELQNVARIEREYVRKKDTLWLMIDKKLHIKELDVIYRDNQHVYARNDDFVGKQMVITDLSRVAEGAALRLNQP